VAQRFECRAVKLPADHGPDRRGEQEQEEILAWKAIHKEHAQNHDRQGEYDTQDEQRAFAFQLRLLAQSTLERVNTALVSSIKLVDVGYRSRQFERHVACLYELCRWRGG